MAPHDPLAAVSKRYGSGTGSLERHRMELSRRPYVTWYGWEERGRRPEPDRAASRRCMRREFYAAGATSKQMRLNRRRHSTAAPAEKLPQEGVRMAGGTVSGGADGDATGLEGS
ncbi:hypothetical protein KCP76_20350 [Salmonella enterica subsp. enterica serovar Weltevreden]|nr:hypothetical protein KCP76_20350 [Salmonella enterica subsp. enterica serovar Weltevreden]